MPTVNLLVIPTTLEIKAQFNLDTDPTYSLFSQTNNDLLLPVTPASYNQVRENTIQVKRGFKERVAQVGQQTVRLEVSLTDGREEIAYILQALMANATADPNNVSLISLYDYHRPERTDYTQGYTLRRGLFTDIATENGSIRLAPEVASRRYHLGSVKFTFEDFAAYGY